MIDLLNKNQLINYLQQHGLYTKKSLGQNFLVDRVALDKIVAAAELSKNDCVIEVGPGLGVLTEELVKQAGRVTAIELDQKLAELLVERMGNKSTPSVIPAKAEIQDRLASQGMDPRVMVPEEWGKPEDDTKKGLSVINSSILNANIAEITQGYSSYKVVANIPYYITSKILRLFLEQVEKKPEVIVLLTQKEVAERVCAKPGQMSLLAVSVQVYGEPEIVDIVKRDSFFPAPAVDSAILRIKISNDEFLISNQIPSFKSQKKEGRRSGEPLDIERLGIDSTLEIRNSGIKDRDFFRCVHVGFAARRKTLLNNLSSGYHLEKKEVLDILKLVGLNENSRAQELSIEKWGELCQNVEIRITNVK